MLDVKTIKELLHKRELKATNSRIDLLSNLDKFGSAMPYSAIQKALKSTDRVTLYRTLQTLSDKGIIHKAAHIDNCLLYTSPSPRDRQKSRMPSSA